MMTFITLVMMMMTFITRGGEGEKIRIKTEKLREEPWYIAISDDDDVVRCFIEATFKHS